MTALGIFPCESPSELAHLLHLGVAMPEIIFSMAYLKSSPEKSNRMIPIDARAPIRLGCIKGKRRYADWIPAAARSRCGDLLANLKSATHEKSVRLARRALSALLSWEKHRLAQDIGRFGDVFLSFFIEILSTVIPWRL